MAGATDSSSAVGQETTTATERVERAWRWLQAALGSRPVPPLVAVIGLGQGDLLLALERRAPATRVLALEPDPHVARAFVSRSDWSRWRETGSLTYLAGPEYAGADDAWRVFPDAPDEHVILVDPILAREGGGHAVEAARTLKRIVFGARANAEARRQFAPRYLTNTLRNAPALAVGRDVRTLTNAYQGVPAVIVAAGPSLDNVIEDLRDLTSRVLLISTDTALRPLLTAGLAPQLTVGLDPSELNARHFQGLPVCPDTWLVSESALDPSTSRHFGDRTFWFRVAGHHPWPWYNELGLDVGVLDVWGSVVTAAFQVACLAGCNPIIAVGADLSYSSGRPYCRGTTYEFDWARAAASGVELREVWQASTTVGEPVRIADLRGVETVTTPALLAFRDWLVAHAAHSGRRVINATGAGMLFGEGIEQMSLVDALPDAPGSASLATIASVAGRRLQPSDLAVRFREVSGAIAAGEPVPVAVQWAAFSGRGWNPAATVAALDQAAAALSGGVAPSADGVEPHPVAARVLQQLPEAVARWRAVLLGFESLPVLSEPLDGADDSAALLVDASDLLTRVSDAAQCETADLAPIAVGENLGRLPLGRLRGWPEPAAWDVEVLEAVLGAVSRSALPDTFFSRAIVPRQSADPQDASGAPRVEQPNATLACALLALEWAMCVTSLEGMDAPGAAQLLTRLRTVVAGIREAGSAGVEPARAAVIVTTTAGGQSRTVELPVSFGEGALARVETGTIRQGQHGSGSPVSATSNVELLARAGGAERSASVALRAGILGHTDADAFLRRRPIMLRVAPRVLTDGGLPRSNITYEGPDGAVCVSLRGSDSFVVSGTGVVKPLHSWPCPITGELPMGSAGAVAWSTGTDRRPGYVMHRPPEGLSGSAEELPFRPQTGAWWRGRLYWACYPYGVGSWAPGEAPTFELPALALWAVHADAGSLVLAPRARTRDGTPYRRLLREGYTWQGTGSPRAIGLDADGVMSDRAGSDRWTAAAFPEADVVRLESGGLVVSMTCYYPIRVAWTGRSLLVSTGHSELLLFEGLMDVLNERLQRDSFRT